MFVFAFMCLHRCTVNAEVIDKFLYAECQQEQPEIHHVSL